MPKVQPALSQPASCRQINCLNVFPIPEAEALSIEKIRALGLPVPGASELGGAHIQHLQKAAPAGARQLGSCRRQDGETETIAGFQARGGLLPALGCGYMRRCPLAHPLRSCRCRPAPTPQRFFAQHEFTAKHLMCCSDCEPLQMNELLEECDADAHQRSGPPPRGGLCNLGVHNEGGGPMDVAAC